MHAGTLETLALNDTSADGWACLARGKRELPNVKRLRIHAKEKPVAADLVPDFTG